MPHDFNYNDDNREEKRKEAETFGFMEKILAFCVAIVAFLVLALAGSFLVFCIRALWLSTNS